MNVTHQISFDAPPIVWMGGGLVFLAVLVCALIAWRRSGYRRSTGGLELLRTLLAGMAWVTLCQPEWEETYRPTERPVLAVLRDDSTSMETRDVVDPLQPHTEPLSRRETAEQLLAGVPWESLADRVDVVMDSFAADPNSSEGRHATDIDTALLATRKRHENLRAVVLVSDGDWNQGKSPLNAATRLRIHDIPIYTLPIGSESALPDIEVIGVEPPTFAVVGKSMQIPFGVRSTLATDYEVDVQLTLPTGGMLEKKVVVPAMGVARDVFFWTPEEVGNIDFQVQVPPHPDESIRENNRAAVTVAIKAESLQVLVVESVPRWEYRYLRNALERDPGVDVACVLFHPGLGKPGGGTGYLPRFPQSAEELAAYDVVFLGDVGVAADQLSSEDCRNIRGLIESQASGLIFMPGMRGHHFSLLETELNDLYPVHLDAENRRGFGTSVAASPVLTERGQASLLTKLADTAQENTAVWRSLPGFQWRSPATRARAGTEVLAIDEHSRAPLLVTKTFGTGKVLFMGTDAVWRWREGVEDRYHYRFWGQVARWMAYQRHMAQGEMLRVFYSPDRPTARNVVTLHATVLDPSNAPLRDGEVTAELTSPDGDRERLRFRSAGNEWGLYSARFSPQQAGSYQLTIRCAETAATLETEIDVQGTQREVIGKPTRPDVLREISQTTRGELVSPDQAGRLCELVLQLPPPEPVVRRRPIWASPWWAGIMIFGMTCFWIGRKFVGSI